MDTLLFLALPLATIILAAILQKLIKCPIVVAAFFFAIYLIVTYAVFDGTFLIFAIVYTILAYISAVITCLIHKLLCNNDEENESDTDDTNNNGCGCGCNMNSGCGCGCRRRR